MKKLGLLLMPLMAASFLTGCKQPTPTPVVDVVHNFHFIGTNCTINGESDYSHNIFEKDKNVQYTIVPYTGYKLPETVEGVEYNPSNGVITISEIKNDIELRVEATHIPQPGVTHTIHLDPAGGTITGDTILTNLPDGYPVENAPTISRDGYDVSEVKWYTEPNGGDEFKFGPKGIGTDVVTDYFLHAKWGDISQFTVNFYNDDGNPYSSLQNIKVNYGDKVTYKDCPIDSKYDNHYKFDGWYNDKPSVTTAQPFQFDTPLTGNPENPISIYAKHTKKQYRVTFDANGGEITSGGEPLDVTYNESIPVDKRPTASRDGYSDTTTWCTDKAGANEFTFGSTPITDNATLYAKWGSPTPSTTYTVTFDAGVNGKFFNNEQKVSYIVKKGEKLLPYIKQLLPPTLEGETFAYYEYEGKNSLIDYDDTVTSDVKLRANYFDITAPLTDLDSPKNISWKEIKAVATTNYNPSSCFKIGATKKVKVNEKDHIVRIIGFSHDYSELPDDGSNPDPSKALGITFEFANVITDSNGNAVTTKEGGDNFDYRNSTLNKFLNDDILNMLPSSGDPDNPDLRNVIKLVDKKVGVSTDGGQNYSATSFDGDAYPYPYLFPLAHDEMATHEDDVTNNEGSKYQYYTEYPGQGNRIKRKAGIETGDGEYYWLRSPCTNTTNFSWGVHGSGGVYNDLTCYRTNGVSPAFCI